MDDSDPLRRAAEHIAALTPTEAEIAEALRRGRIAITPGEAIVQHGDCETHALFPEEPHYPRKVVAMAILNAERAAQPPPPGLADAIQRAAERCGVYALDLKDWPNVVAGEVISLRTRLAALAGKEGG